MYTPEEMERHRQNLVHWKELPVTGKSKVVVHSKELLQYMQDTKDHEEVVAKLTNDSCIILERRKLSDIRSRLNYPRDIHI